MRILIISDSYPPEVRSAAQLMRDLAEGFCEKGHEVYVATTYPQYNLADKSQAEAPELRKENGVKILRIKTLPHHRVNFIIRGIAQLLMPYIFFNKIKKNIKGKIDTVIVHSPPLPLARAAYKVKKFYGAKYILNLHDIFPQNAVDLGILKNKILIKLFEWMEKREYRDADLIVVPSNQHKKFIEQYRGVPEEKVRVIYHWIDSEPFRNAKKTDRFRKMYGLEGKFIFLFGGVLGPSQGLDIILEAAAKLKDNKEIVFLFVGDGSDKGRLMRLAEKQNLKNVVFEPFVSADEYPELVKNCDVGIICLSSQNKTPAVPAKILGYMAAAIPVVAFLQKESDGLTIVSDSKCGFAVISDDKAAVFNAIKKIYSEKENLEEYGENGLSYLLEHMKKSVGVREFEKLL